jgi:four helix bundle protein
MGHPDCEKRQENPWRAYVPKRPRHSLDVWHLAKSFTVAVYKLTGGFPSAEKFGLTSQLRRAANSVHSNIAEGAARGSRKEFRRFLYQARGSLEEIDSQLEVAGELGFLGGEDLDDMAELFSRLSRALAGTIKSVDDAD